MKEVLEEKKVLPKMVVEPRPQVPIANTCRQPSNCH
jgi:hypothetical protein